MATVGDSEGEVNDDHDHDHHDHHNHHDHHDHDHDYHDHDHNNNNGYHHSTPNRCREQLLVGWKRGWGWGRRGGRRR
jgi:hypothetical protein